MSNTMSPDASPGVTKKNAGVRRVNNLPLYIVVGIMLTFLLINVIVMIQQFSSSHMTFFVFTSC